MNAPSPISVGKIYLVGAGPGDPGMLTLRGAECLGRADVVLYDYLVNPQVLAHARSGAEQICLGRHGHTRIWTQEEINQALVEMATAGKTVVRLKGGDPAVFARGAEEAEVLAAHQIPFEVVPGITVALAAGSCAGIPATHHQLASAVALVTGQERGGKESSNLDFQALAKFPGTLVVYMGVTTAERWTADLIAAGKSADTPAAIVRRCSWPDQRTVQTTLGQVADQMKTAGIRPPTIVIIGEVVRLAPTLSWFAQRPLFGSSVLITRPADQMLPLQGMLVELGAEVLQQPAIEISAPADWQPVDERLARLAEFDWLVFSSSNGVRWLLDRLPATGRDLRALGGVRIAAIGPGTAEELARYRLQADLVPDVYRAESLAAALAENAAGKRFLLARASRGREVLSEELTAAGAEVEQVVVYASRDVTTPDADLLARLRAGEIDWITVTSSAIARSLAAMYGADLHHARLVSISPITSGTLRELGYEPAAEATQYDMPGVVAALVQARS